MTAIGFLAWGFYSALLDLGFWVLAPAQYLAAGVLVLVWSFAALWGMLAGQLAAYGRAKKPRTPRAARIWFTWVGGLFAGCAVSGLVVYANSLLRSFWFFAFFGVLLSLAYGLAAFVSSPPFERMETGKEKEKFRVGRLVILCTAILLVTSFPVGFGVLETVSEGWGGGKPRDAVLTINRDALDAATQDALLAPGNETGSSAKTVPVRVLLHNDAWFFVHVAGSHDKPGETYQISTQAITLVQWLGK